MGARSSLPAEHHRAEGLVEGESLVAATSLPASCTFPSEDSSVVTRESISCDDGQSSLSDSSTDEVTMDLTLADDTLQIWRIHYAAVDNVVPSPTKSPGWKPHHHFYQLDEDSKQNSHRYQATTPTEVGHRRFRPVTQPIKCPPPRECTVSFTNAEEQYLQRLYKKKTWDMYWRIKRSQTSGGSSEQLPSLVMDENTSVQRKLRPSHEDHTSVIDTAESISHPASYDALYPSSSSDRLIFHLE